MRAQHATAYPITDSQLVVLPSAFAQNNAPVTFTDPDSGITFNSWGLAANSPQTKGGFTFGVALPSDALETDATEFIGYLVGYAQTHKRLFVRANSPSNAQGTTRADGAASLWAAP